MRSRLRELRSVRGDRWGTFMVRRHFRHPGMTDPGEAAAFAALGSLDGLSVLDIGVGGGRTTPTLAPAAGRYVGVDTSPRLLDDARRRHPGVDYRLDDARALTTVSSGEYDLVVFSFNGIDVVEHEERALVLEEMRRVLRPGGRVLLSMFNLVDPGAEGRPRPRLSDLFTTPEPTGWKRPVMRVRNATYGTVAFWNFRQARRGARDGQDWMTWPMAQHEYRFLVHFSRFGAAVDELEAAGFAVEDAYDNNGTRVPVRTPAHDAGYTHMIARRR